MVAAIAEALRFSRAVGALFAGLAFSRDRGRLRLARAFETLFRFFVPFFVVGIGLDVAVGALGAESGSTVFCRASRSLAKLPARRCRWSP